MKKLVLVLGLVLCMLALCACGTEKTAEESAAPQPLQERTLPELSREESLAMLRYMFANRALIDGERLFCLDYDGDYLPVLAEYSLEGGMRRSRVLADACVPEYLCRLDDSLFYINARAEDALERVDLQSGKREVLQPGPCGWLLIRDGELHYCGADQQLYACDPAGKNERLLLDRPCACPWPLGESLLYQSLADGRLHLYEQEGDRDLSLTESEATRPILWADRLYYSAGESLCAMDLNGLDARRLPVPALAYPAELLPEEAGLLLRGITDDNGLKQWSAAAENVPGTLQYLAERGYRLCDYQGPEGRVEAIYNPDGRVRCFAFTDAAGEETIYIAGRASG